MQDAIIIGGGITGLTTGYLLQKKGLDISVIEKNLRPGGPIQSVEHNGYLVEKGPNSLLLPDKWAEEFIHEIGIGSDILETDPSAKKRYIVRNGRPVAVPASIFQAITTPLFSLKAKIGFLGEPFRRRKRNIDENSETVSQFVKRRMGQEFLDYAINPFVRGVYAGDPDELVLKHAFPMMLGFERDGGSITKGALKHKKRSKAGDGFKKRSVNFRNGLASLPRTIARKLGNRLWLGSNVVAVNRNDQGWQVTWKKDGENFEGFSKHLFICLPSRGTKELTWPHPISDILESTPDLPYPTVHCLGMGFRREQISHPLDGFGVLVPSKEKHQILGALFNSSMYPNRAPEGECLLTVMLGGRQRPDLAHATESQLIDFASKDLQSLLGAKGKPAFQYLTTWKRAIPQYTVDFGYWKRSIHKLEAEIPSLYFGGHSIDGISIGASMLSAKRLSEKL